MKFKDPSAADKVLEALIICRDMLRRTPYSNLLKDEVFALKKAEEAIEAALTPTKFPTLEDVSKQLYDSLSVLITNQPETESFRSATFKGADACIEFEMFKNRN